MEVDALDTALMSAATNAAALDRSGEWPAADLTALAAAGAMRWALPKELGGVGLSPLELHLRYELVAAGSLPLALILSQRDSALGLVLGAANDSLRRELLAGFASDAMFATIGIAQLTTSRQGGPPALIARPAGDGFVLDGFVPWSTGADRSRFVIGGAMVEGGGQILFALPTNLPGVRVPAPLPLVAMAASHTGTVVCESARLDRRWILTGPGDRVLGGGRGLTLGQTFLAMGLCRSTVQLIARHDLKTGRNIAQPFEAQLQAIRDEVLALSQPGREAEAAEANARLRGACNELAVRVTHAAVALYKGTALMLDHPAQRLAREALFLLVWSCPNPVIDCTVGLLSEGRED